MASLEEIRQARLAKLTLLKAAGMEAYPAKVPRDMPLKELRADFAALQAAGKEVAVAGRVMAVRGQGAIFFVVLDDGTDRFQAVFKKDEMDAAAFSLFADAADIGDIVSISGVPFVTQRGEQSVLAKGWRMASKSLQPLPEKWHGLIDEDERFRKRYLDMAMTPELRDLFYKKSKFWEVTRNFLKQHGFLEVETPTLETTTGGAEARPFETHHNDFDIDVFLRISIGELWQKRLMAGGFPKTFEIGRAYRNEGSSPEHLQEFTNMEFYWGYANYKDGMNLVKDLYRTVAKEVFGTTKFTTRGHTFDLMDEWREVNYVDEIKTQTGVDVLTANEADMMKKLKELGVLYEGENRERLTDTLWKYCRKKIAGPAFLTHHPKLVSALAKESKDRPGTVERFQVLLAGSEIGNGYSELNDPIDQRARFDLQQKLIEGGDEEAMMPDWEFVEMLEHGMPPTCGFGFGDRLFAFLVDKPLRETVMFPLMKNKEEGSKKKAGTKSAAVILDKSLKLADWQRLNAAAHLSAALAARHGSDLLMQESVVTKDGKKIPLNIRHAILMKEAADSAAIRDLIGKARAEGLEVFEFTREMISSTNDKKVAEETGKKDWSDVERLGILLFGDKKAVDALSKDLPLVS